MDSLVGKHSVTAVRKALEVLPKEVDDTYDEAMERIERQNEDDKNLAKPILSWITYARRPLTVSELQHALAVMPDMTDMDPDNIIDKDILTSVCAGLVVVDEEQSTVRLVRKYLEPRTCNLSPVLIPSQTAQHNNISNAIETPDFQTLKPESQRHVLRTSHSTCLGEVTATTNLSYCHSWKTILYWTMLLGIGAIIPVGWISAKASL